MLDWWTFIAYRSKSILCDSAVAVTQVFRQPRGLLVDYFDSKEDLINALLTSCFIPGYVQKLLWPPKRVLFNMPKQKLRKYCRVSCQHLIYVSWLLWFCSHKPLTSPHKSCWKLWFRYLAPRPVTVFRNRICVDGGITLFMPPTAADQTVCSSLIVSLYSLY